jgi:hypothetical protein
MKTLDLDRNIVEAAYVRWAPIYDAVCGPVMVKGRRAAASAARAVGGRILEVGVGARINEDAVLVERRKVAPFGIYTLVCFERRLAA